MPRTQTNKAAAFTLVEVLVVAPLIILFIGAFIGLVVTLTGDSLKLRESNAAAFGVQDALDEMGTASGNALGFLTTTGPLVAPQGSGNNTAAFTNVNSGQANTLIISSAATTKNPYDVSRQLVYTGSSPCSSSNPVYSYTTVYFISGSSLYKRTILPASPAPCTTPWQKPSCEESRVASNPAVCKASDEKLLDNVAGMTITYYDSASSTTPIPASQAEDAVSVSIQLESSKSVAGETVNYTGSSRVKRGEGGIQSSSDNRLATGAFFSCGLKNGSAYCWGRNQYGQLGNGTTNDSSTPVAVSTSGVLNGKTITQISVGTEHSCAIADEKLYCWGANAYGTFGNGFGSGSSSTTPVAAATGNSLLTNKIISNVNLGGIHTCVVAEQRGYCWGGNYNGQLGINQTGNAQHVPNAVYTAGVLSGKNVDQVSSGSGNHTCAVAEGLAYCWGKNGDSGTGTSGQLGDGTSTGKVVPVAVTASGVLSGKTVTDISASSINSCAVASGKAYCWGSNSEGQIGNGNTTNQYNPAAVVDTGALSGKRVTEVSVGPWLSCAIASGSFYCWGLGTNGQLGNGTALSSNVPVAVSQGAMP